MQVNSFFKRISFIIIIIIILLFLRLHMWHMEVPRLGVESELQLPAYTTATWDPSHICDLHRSSWQHQDPQGNERGQESNPHPRGYQSDLLMLNHKGNSASKCKKWCPGVTFVAQWLKNPTRIHEDMGSIPGLDQ